MEFHLDLSLQRSAIISWSGWFWNRPDIRNKIKDIIDRKDLKDLNLKESIRDLVDVAKGYLKTVDIPRLLYERLVDTIIMLGPRAMYWYYSTSREYASIPFGYTKALHWTVLGTVDEAKIVENSWIEKLETLENDEQMYDIYYMACGSILKDFINSNADKMLSKAELWSSRAANNEKWKFIACSVLTLASPENVSEEKKIELISKYNFTSLNDRKEAYMFSMSVRKGHFIAARYYWHQLNSLDKEEKFIEAAGICMRIIQSYSNDPHPNSFTDILLFLLSEVLKEGVEQFFFTRYMELEFWEFRNEFLNTLIRSYGWENYFFSVFDLYKSEINGGEYYSLLQCILDALHERRRMGLDSKATIYHRMFSLVLSETDFEADRNFYSNNKSKIIDIAFHLFDLDVINMISEKYSDSRIDFLTEGKLKFEKLISDKKFNLLGEFVETVLRSEGEREWFRSCHVDYLYGFIRADAFHLADNLLNVLGSSEEERKRIKHKIDFLSLTAEFFTKSKYTFAEKILHWGFSDEKEKDEYFNTFTCPGLIYWGHKTRMSHFLIIFWKEHIDKNHFILSLSEFLNWFFGSENSNYKISKIFSETLLRNFFKAIYEMEVTNKGKCFFARNVFKKMDELMKLCVPLEDLAKLRTDITQNACKWLTECVFLGRDYKLNCWGLLDSFLDWVLEYRGGSLNYEKKQEFVKSLLLTRDGLELFRLIVCRCFEVNNYLCLWIEWAGGISQIEQLLHEMGLPPDGSRIFQENFQCLKQMFEKFERRKESPLTALKHTCL